MTNDYHWTVDSAVWQITHGGPTHRTLSAIEHLNYVLSDHENVFGLVSQVPACQLLDALIETRGLQNLGDTLAPLPDATESVEEQLNANLEDIGNAIKDMKREGFDSTE